MAEIKGVNILGTIVPYTTADLYATHDAKYGRGGWRSVQNRTERDNLKEDYLQEGMAVRVIDDDTTYIWTKVADESEQGWHMEWASDSLKLRVTEGYVDVSTDGHRYDPSGNVIDASKGDYYVYIEGNDTHTDEYGRTGYVYDGSVWKALSGNVTAENVYFPSGVDRTETWGRKAAQTAVSKEEAKGKNLKDLIEYYILKEQFPTNVQGHYSNDSAPSWSITYNEIPTEHSVYLDASYTNKAQSGIWYTAGTQFYVPALTYSPIITAKQGNVSLSSGDVKTFTIGPSYINGMPYGYWKQGASATYGEKDRINSSTVTFNDASVTKVGGGVYRPKQTSHDASVTYTYNNSKTTSKMKFFESAIMLDDVSTKEYTSNGDASVNTQARVLTLNSTGTATITLKIINGNSWTSTYTNDTIPKSDVIRVSTNKNNPMIEEESNKTKDVSVAAKKVGSGTTKHPYATYEDGESWTFKAKSAYPTYVLRCTSAKPTLEQSTFEYVPYAIDKFPQKANFNFANGAASPFSKRQVGYTPDWATSKSFIIWVPQVLGKPSPKIWDANEWKPVADMVKNGTPIEVDVNKNAKKVPYYEYQFSALNGLDATYKLAY